MWNIAYRSPTYKCYWVQWKSLAVGNCIQERKKESTNGQSQIAQIIIPRSRVKELLTELHCGPSGGHLDINKTQNKVRQMYSWLQTRSTFEKLCGGCDTAAYNRGPRTRNQGPNVPVQHCGAVRKDSNSCIRNLSTERPRKQ
jgi:hypothetical protein